MKRNPIYAAGPVVSLAKSKSEPTPCFRMEKKDSIGEIYLYDVIGDSWDGTTAKSFSVNLKALKEVRTLNIYIDSPGGSVFDGIAIYNQLIRHNARKVVHIDGLAASIASVIAMAGDEINIASNGFMMIHDPWSIAMGTAEDFRKVAETLDKIRDTLVGTYAARSGAKEEEIARMMADETWFNAESALEAGLVDNISEAAKMAALARIGEFDYRNLPKNLTEETKLENTSSEGDKPFKGSTHPAILKARARIAKRRA